MAKRTILLTGASGNIGKATLAALGSFAAELDVKAGVRDPAKSADLAAAAANVSVVAADPLNESQIQDALKGVDAVYVIAPGHVDRTKITIAAIDAAKAAGVKFILVLSVLTADLTDTVFGGQFAPIEASAKASGIPYAIIRLPIFLDNNWGNAGTIKAQKTWYDAFEPEKPYTPATVQDLGEASAKILANPEPHIGKTYRLASPADTNANLAKYFSEATGNTITYTPVSYDDVIKALTGNGFEDWQAKGIVELEKLVNAESPVLNDPQGAKDLEAILGRPPTTFEGWVKGVAAGFK